MMAAMRALPSAKDQVDDIAVIDSYAATIVGYHDPGGTLASARNLCAEVATGEYLTFLDADDELSPNYIEAINHKIESVLYPEMTMFTPAVQYVHGEVKQDPILLPPRDLRTGNYLVIGTTVPRAAFLEAGGFQEWPAWEDWALYLRLDAMGLGVVQVPRAVYKAWVQPVSRNEAATDNVGLFNEILADFDAWDAQRDQ